jgi:hypothetical protein
VVGVALILAFIVGWLGLRAQMAQRALSEAVPEAAQLKDAIASGDLSGAGRVAASLRGHARTAAELTSDPIWRAAEWLPWAGQNFAAVRLMAAASDSLASDVLQPLVSVSADVDIHNLAIHEGAIDIAPLVAAQPAVVKAQLAFDAARSSLDGIDTGPLIGRVASGIDRLRTVLDQAAPQIETVGNAARLLPGMLGADGPRNYLVVAQNPAELRATGGLIGSIALVHVDNGAISLARQSSDAALGPWEQDIASIPPATQGLFGPLVGRFVQDANLTPDFPLAATTVSRMWTTTYGGTIDGVVAVDPVVLSGLLQSTGPVVLPTGDQLTSANAVKLLLSDVYQRYENPAQQDEFFSTAANAVFERVVAGGVDAKALVNMLAQAGTARRLLIWSAAPGEQKVLATTTLSGGLPRSDASTAGVGVYFNDGTGSKMDYYLGTSVAAGSAICRADRKPSTVVSITLTNRAPADAATSLPRYVTGDGMSGMSLGSIRTRVAVYGPSDGLLAGTISDGASYKTVSGTDHARPVSVFTVELPPGGSQTVTVQFLSEKQKQAGVAVQMTPTLPGDGSTPDPAAIPTVSPIAVDCGSVIK